MKNRQKQINLTEEEIKSLSEALKRDKGRILIQCQGGGYDGCFWEWNYTLVDFGEKEIQYLASTGCSGAKDVQSQIARLKEDRFYLIDIDNAEEWEEFCNKAAPAHVLFVAKIMEKEVECFMCEEKIVPDGTNFELIGGKGDGGIGMNYSNYVCSDCYSANTCEQCGEYDEDLEDGICPYCREGVS